VTVQTLTSSPNPMILHASAGHVPDAALVAPARRSVTPSRRHSPTRRFTNLGPRCLGTEELVCAILGNSRAHASSLRATAALWAEFAGPDGELLLRSVAAADVPQIARAAGISRASAARLLAGLELGRRAAQEDRPNGDRLRGAGDIYERLRLRLCDLRHEEFWVLLLNTQHEVLRDLAISVGLVHATLAHPREVFRAAIRDAAYAVVLVHNHPSGDPTPSSEDHALTAALVRAGEAVGIPVLDHVVIGEGRYFSFLERGALPYSAVAPDYATGPR
jgi:DNA repair protein RadC